MQNIVTMVESASVTLLAVLAVSEVQDRFKRRPRTRALVLGALFGLVGLVVMDNAVEIAPGIRTDPRAAVVALSAAFGGPLAAALTAPFLAAVRLSQGGIGAVPGATYILGVGFAAALVHYLWFGIARKRADGRFVLLQAVVAGAVPVLILLFVSSAPWDVFMVSNALAVPTNFLAALVMGTMVLRDIERRAAVRRQADIQAQIDTIANNAPAVLFQLVLDKEGRPRFTYVSQASEHVLHVAPRTLTEDFSALEAIAIPSADTKIVEQLRVSQASGNAWNLELEGRRPDGGPFWIRIDAGIRADRAGRSIWNGSISDITEHKRAERLKDDFISTVSHELRTPLTSIRGALGLIVGTAGDQLPPRLTNLLEIANRNAERLVLLINDILDMQKIQSGQISFVLRREPLRPLIDQALVAAQSYAPEKNIRFVVQDEAPRGLADVDPDRFNQVLMNLLSNAIKFSPEGGHVTVSVHEVGGSVRLSVSDEGLGIPEEFRRKIFDRFSQAESSYTRKTGGTGLGLNISKSIVEVMGGTLRFDSVKGEGATFHIDLPRPDEPEADEKGDRPASAAGRRILVWSTDQRFNVLVGLAVGGGDLLLDSVPDSTSAIEFLSARQYAAVVLDAGSTGIEALATLQDSAQAGDVPVIVVAAEATGQREIVADAGLGVVSWLERPVDEERMRSALMAALSQRGRTRPNILHVEDDPSIREIMRRNLAEAAHMIEAGSVGAARRALAARRFDLVLLDMQLPDGSGEEILREVPAGVPVVIFTAFEVSTDMENRAVRVMTKSRMPEDQVARAVLAALPAPAVTDQGGEQQVA